MNNFIAFASHAGYDLKLTINKIERLRRIKMNENVFLMKILFEQF